MIVIIVLIILSAITIITLTGENGLVNRAKTVGEENKYATAEEKVKLAVIASVGENANLDKALLKENVNNIEGLQSQVSEINYDLTIIVDGYEFKITELGKVTGIGVVNKLPENTPTTDAGTEVAIKDSWGTEAMRVVKTENGEEKEITKVATVYAVSGGEGETVPVPYGFYYVGGTVNSGVVISDNAKDKNKYVGQEDVGKDLEGNQFVWIPCSIENYKKYNWGYEATTFNKITNTAEEIQIKKYGGFYVGRYEAGTSQVILKNGKKIGDERLTTGWQNNSYTIEKVTEESKPTTKANEIPYYHVSTEIAETMSKRMYDTNYVYSGLITGTQWDVMINFLSNETDKSEVNALDASKYSDLKAESTWGNYYNTTLNNCEGKYCNFNEHGSMISDWEENTTKTNRVSAFTLLTTGATEEVKRKNLYDVAGNLWECVQETAGTAGTHYSIRGGCCFNPYAVKCVCCRDYINFTEANCSQGFRPVLYIF